MAEILEHSGEEVLDKELSEKIENFSKKSETNVAEYQTNLFSILSL